jgi:autotransporter-associated beta strand protein
MKYAAEIGSDTMIYIPSFIKTGAGIQKLNGADTHTGNALLSLLLFFQNKESGIIIISHACTSARTHKP